MHKLRDASGDSEEDLRRQIEDFAGDGRVYVLGLGNTDRADDGAGILVALALKKRFPSFSYSEHDGVEGTVLDISEKEEVATVLFVDAADMGLEPGSIRFIPKDKIKETEITTHRVAVALMASILERSGKKAAVIGIQPETIEFRGRVSTPVQTSIKKVVDALLGLMMRIDR
jgi:hydrogenase 3 maturation protease